MDRTVHLCAGISVSGPTPVPTERGGLFRDTMIPKNAAHDERSSSLKISIVSRSRSEEIMGPCVRLVSCNWAEALMPAEASTIQSETVRRFRGYAKQLSSRRICTEWQALGPILTARKHRAIEPASMTGRLQGRSVHFGLSASKRAFHRHGARAWRRFVISLETTGRTFFTGRDPPQGWEGMAG
jgi:hypothetical protein